MDNFSNCGLLKIKDREDRVAVAMVLFKNGYTVAPKRKKISPKNYEQYLEFSRAPEDLEEEVKG